MREMGRVMRRVLPRFRAPWILVSSLVLASVWIPGGVRGSVPEPPPTPAVGSPAARPPTPAVGSPAARPPTPAVGSPASRPASPEPGSPAPAQTVGPNGQPLPGMKPWWTRRNPVEWDAYGAAKACALFREHCAPCHGPAGRGDGPRAAACSPGTPRPADLAQGRWRYGGEDGQLMRTIWLGVPGTAMAGWQSPDRTPRDAWLLVHWVRRGCVPEQRPSTWDTEPPPPGSR